MWTLGMCYMDIRWVMCEHQEGLCGCYGCVMWASEGSCVNTRNAYVDIRDVLCGHQGVMYGHQEYKLSMERHHDFACCYNSFLLFFSIMSFSFCHFLFF